MKPTGFVAVVLVLSIIPSVATAQRTPVTMLAGAHYPQGAFGNGHDYGFGVTVVAEWATSDAVAIEGTLGAQRFDGQSNSGLGLHHVSAGVRIYASTAGTRIFARGAVGIYSHNLDFIDPGVSLGAGIQFPAGRPIQCEIAYGYTTVMTGGVQTTFSSILAGVRFTVGRDR